MGGKRRGAVGGGGGDVGKGRGGLCFSIKNKKGQRGAGGDVLGFQRGEGFLGDGGGGGGKTRGGFY